MEARRAELQGMKASERRSAAAAVSIDIDGDWGDLSKDEKIESILAAQFRTGGAQSSVARAAYGVEGRDPEEPLQAVALHAAEQGHALACKTLLELYADPSLRDDDGDTPLDTARAKGHKGCVALLEAAMQ